MAKPTSLPLKAQIAMLAGAVAVAGTLAISLLPDAVYAVRDMLFESQLPEAERAQLREAVRQHEACGERYNASRAQFGFDAWRLNYYGVVAVLGLGATLLTAALAWRAASRVASPIEALARTARRVSAGYRDGPGPLPAIAGAEVQALHADFAVMTSALKAADDDLRLRSAALAHDIRTPLTIIKGRLIGLREQIFVADASFVDGLLHQVAFIDHLVSEVNALSDARAAQAAGADAVDWSALTQQALDALVPEFNAAGVRLDCQITPAVVVMADSLRLNRALVNVLRNVLRYAPGAPLKVHLFIHGDEAVLRCEDHGPGWPAGDPMVYAEPFARGEASRSADTGGTGLGLSIVKAVAVAYGGTLRLARAPEGGALVEMRLPLATA